MKTSEAGKIFIKKYESFRAKMYLDQGGRPTIGYGHLIEKDDPNGYMTKTLTLTEGDELFDLDLYYKAERCINKYIKIPLNQFEYDALASFVFNIGCGNFITSTLIKKMYDAHFTTEDVANEMLRWNKVRINKEYIVSNGLTKRREAERDMFLGKVVPIVGVD